MRVSETFVKPISHYVNVSKIIESIQKLSPENLLMYLSNHDILVWKVSTDLFIAFDHESKHKNLYRVSAVSIPLNEENLLKLSLEKIYGVKLYTERDLRNILRGLIIHKEYVHALGFVIPCESEVKVMDKNKRVVGSVDLACGNFIIEIKSSFALKQEHIYQLLIYMDVLNKPYGFLVYYDKIFKFSLDKEQDKLLEAYNRLRKIYDKVSSLAENISHYENYILKRFNIKIGELMKKLDSLGLG